MMQHLTLRDPDLGVRGRRLLDDSQERCPTAELQKEKRKKINQISAPARETRGTIARYFCALVVRIFPLTVFDLIPCDITLSVSAYSILIPSFLGYVFKRASTKAKNTIDNARLRSSPGGQLASPDPSQGPCTSSWQIC